MVVEAIITHIFAVGAGHIQKEASIEGSFKNKPE